MARKTQPAGPSGLLVVDKPAGFTSHDVVARLRRLAGTRRVGHAGTLDPMATGVLILGINKATKLLTWITGESKTYSATIRLGQSTVTDDAEGEITETAAGDAVAGLEPDRIDAEIRRLTGPIQQVPSSVSAIKVDGQRSYARVRSGQQVELAARPVTIHEFTRHEVRSATTEDGLAVLDVDVEVSCSSGTYIRALARDLGAALGVGGHLTALRRTSIGRVTLEDAATLTGLAEAREAGEGLPILPLEQAADRLFARRDLSAAEASDFSNGRWVEPSGVEPRAHDAAAPGSASAGGDGAEPRTVSTGAGEGVVPASSLTACYAPDGVLIALAQNQRRRGRDVAVPHLVFESGRTYSSEEGAA